MADAQPTTKKILVAVDGSEHSGKAARFAIQLAQNFDAELLALSVYRHYSYSESSVAMVRPREVPVQLDSVMQEVAEDAVAWVEERVAEAGLKKFRKIVKRGPPARTIVKEARKNGVDVVVMGSRGLGDVEGFFLGSVSHKVNALCECTCITVK